MSRNRLRVDADLSPFYRALEAIEGPGPNTRAALTATFAEAFAYVDSRIPVDTGRLKASARPAISEEPGDEWSASVTWGSPGTGVVYAPQAIYHAHSFDGLVSRNGGLFTPHPRIVAAQSLSIYCRRKALNIT